MNLKDLKRLRLLLDFISRGPDASGPHLEPQRLCDLLRPLSCSIYVFKLCVLKKVNFAVFYTVNTVFWKVHYTCNFCVQRSVFAVIPS